MSYLVDTDWLIDALHGIRPPLETLDDLTDEGLSVSIITFGELYEGAFHFPEPDQHIAMFRRFLSGYSMLGLMDPIMERFARLRSQLRRQGNLIPDMDLLIAATALHHNLTLVTHNIRHFDRIPGLQLYR
jgi:tRNA(fMet)-specific endonuclease VapC